MSQPQTASRSVQPFLHSSEQNALKVAIFRLKIEKFSGEGARPLPRICRDLSTSAAVCLHIGGQKFAQISSVQTKNHQAGALPQTPLWELTTLPQIPKEDPQTAHATARTLRFAPSALVPDCGAQIMVTLWQAASAAVSVIDVICRETRTDAHVSDCHVSPHTVRLCAAWDRPNWTPNSTQLRSPVQQPLTVNVLFHVIPRPAKQNNSAVIGAGFFCPPVTLSERGGVA